jgi:hypothetical protein
MKGWLSRVHNGSDSQSGDQAIVRPRVTARGGLGTIADLIAVVTAVLTVWSLMKEGPPPQSILAVCLGLLALAFMFLSFRLQRQQATELMKEKRRSRHSESLSYIQESAAFLRNAATMVSEGERPSSFTEPASHAAGKLAEAMTAATGVKCRVVVKTVYAPGGREDVAVKTFVTSEAVVAQPTSSSVIDWVKDNTDFDEIFYQNEAYFLSNDLSKELELGYRNSHFTREILRNGLPYLSTLVLPIYGPKGPNAYDIVGFLCVDTKTRNSFDPESDVVVGQTMASLWYLALERYASAKESHADGKTNNEHGSDAVDGETVATLLYWIEHYEAATRAHAHGRLTNEGAAADGQAGSNPILGMHVGGPDSDGPEVSLVDRDIESGGTSS